MRLSPQSMRLLALASVSFAAVIAACSSSSTEEVLAADAGSDTSSSSIDSGGTPDTGGGFDTGTTSETSTRIDAGPQYDAGPPVVLDGGPENEGGIPCVQGGVVEVEPNQSAAQATPFTTSICGVIAPASGSDAAVVPDAASNAESDFTTFTLKSSTSSFFVQFSGDVTLVITVDGQSVTLTPTSFPAIPFVKGKPYIVEVKANTSAKTFWRVSLFES